MSDEELYEMYASIADLTEQAQQILSDEMKSRGLKRQSASGQETSSQAIPWLLCLILTALSRWLMTERRRTICRGSIRGRRRSAIAMTVRCGPAPGSVEGGGNRQLD